MGCVTRGIRRRGTWQAAPAELDAAARHHAIPARTTFCVCSAAMPAPQTWVAPSRAVRDARDDHGRRTAPASPVMRVSRLSGPAAGLFRVAPFAVTVDVVLITILTGELRIFLIQRAGRPHLGEWARPGGLVMKFEPLEEAAIRIVDEEIELAPRPGHLEQLRADGDPVRDPRTRVVTVAYWAVAPLLSPAHFDRGAGREQHRHLCGVRPRAGDRERTVASLLRPRPHRVRRPGPGARPSGDDHPGAPVLATRVHDQPAPESVRGRRVGDATRHDRFGEVG